MLTSEFKHLNHSNVENEVTDELHVVR